MYKVSNFLWTRKLNEQFNRDNLSCFLSWYEIVFEMFLWKSTVDFWTLQQAKLLIWFITCSDSTSKSNKFLSSII